MHLMASIGLRMGIITIALMVSSCWQRDDRRVTTAPVEDVTKSGQGRRPVTTKQDEDLVNEMILKIDGVRIGDRQEVVERVLGVPSLRCYGGGGNDTLDYHSYIVGQQTLWLIYSRTDQNAPWIIEQLILGNAFTGGLVRVSSPLLPADEQIEWQDARNRREAR